MSYKHWTEEDDKYLKRHYPMTTNRELADRMGRTITSVKSRAKCLDLEKSLSHSWGKKG